jgi:membrane-associated phospholipid phosphatase
VRWYEGAAVLGLAGLAFANDRGIRSQVMHNETGFRNALADLGDQMGHGIIVFPALVAGTLGGKALGAPGLSRASWRALQAAVVSTAAVLLTKTVVGRARPFQSPGDAYAFSPFHTDDNAFPSGHTALMFAVAGTFAIETKDSWSDAAFYGLATITGFARMQHDKHWASDVVVGAGVGILSARFVTRKNRRGLILAPGVVGVNLTF